MTTNLIILAGGASSRMKSSLSHNLDTTHIEQANTRSKALILLNDRPMLDYILYNAKQAGIIDVFIVVSPTDNLFKTYYGANSSGNQFHGLTISYAVQKIPNDRSKPLGTADAVLQTLEQYPELQSESFLVCNCDNLYSSNAIRSLSMVVTPNALINYDRDSLKYSSERIARFALTKVNSQNMLEDIIEKPSENEMESYCGLDGSFRVSMNIFKFDGSMFYQYLKSCPLHPDRNEKELPTALLNMIKDHPESTLCIPFSEHVPDLTSKEDISIMNEYLTSRYPNLDWNN